jgi:hypothetical protein
MSLSRQQRRARLKESVDSVRRGIDLDATAPSQLWSMIGLTRVMLDVLQTKSPTRASDAVRRAHEFFEISLKRNPSNHRIACAKGCGFCCHMRVTALAPEIFHAANHIRKAYAADFDAVLARLREREALSRGLSARERPARHIACGMLVDNACSIYEARPSSCRGLTSVSVETCERGYNGEEVEVLTPAVWTEVRAAHNQALWAALVAAGLRADAYEFNHALLIALEIPDAERRWLAGEDVLAEVSCDGLLEGQDVERKRRLIDVLTAGALGKELP